MDVNTIEITRKASRKSWFLLSLCYITFFLYASCTTVPVPSPLTSVEPSVETEQVSSQLTQYVWIPVATGLSLAQSFIADPPLAVYCLRVDLENPHVSVEVISTEGTPTLRRTSTIVRKYSLVAAVNATPFSPVQLFEGKQAYIAGLSVTNGREISPPSKKYAAIVFESNNRARILSASQAALWKPGPLDHGCGGFSLLLQNSVITSAEFENVFDSGKAPRTAAGTNESGRYLYLMVIDGKKRGYSVGATFYETAQWIASFGATDALMLDGGGSSTLALRNENGKVKLINTPVQGAIPWIERPVANHIGIRLTEP